MIALLLSSCHEKINNEYSGYIYNESRPLKNVKVIEEQTTNYTLTNDEGFFLLIR
jgi:hypothetical protein